MIMFLYEGYITENASEEEGVARELHRVRYARAIVDVIWCQGPAVKWWGDPIVNSYTWTVSSYSQTHAYCIELAADRLRYIHKKSLGCILARVSL